MMLEEGRREEPPKAGGAGHANESHGARPGLPWLETLWQDVRFGLRMLCKSPGFAIVALLTMALGIGATTAIFTVVNSVLLEPLPYPDPDRVVMFMQTYPQGTNPVISIPKYVLWTEQTRILEDFCVHDIGGLR